MIFEKSSKYLGLFTLLLSWMLPMSAQAVLFDFSDWDRTLKEHVRPSSLHGIRLSGFNYAALKKSPQHFSAVLTRLEQFDPKELRNRDDKLAFWINVYNIGAIKLALDHEGINSLNEIGPNKGAVWKMRSLRVGGNSYSLDEVENKILRKFSEPRIHFAIVCASVSCPDLRAESYQPKKLAQQLDKQTRAFLSNDKKGLRIDSANKKLVVTKIFEWFAADFGGKTGIKSFLARYTRGSAASKQWNDYSLAYFDYDWSLNRI